MKSEKIEKLKTYGKCVRFGNLYLLIVTESDKPYVSVVDGWPGITDEEHVKNLA